MRKQLNITKERFGRLVALCLTGYRTRGGNVIWLCRCDCGNYAFVSTNNLRSGITKSCGCFQKEIVKKDITGKNFGELSAIEPTKKRSGGNVVWKCLCSCGRYTFVSTSDLKSGATKSCGCLRRKLFIKRSTKHGKCGTSEYQTWGDMIQRCYNRNNPSYKNYGKRGIRVCERWKNSFSNFIEDMGKRPSLDLSIDRIDNDGNYE